jgi:hypothetical protein
MPSAASLVKSRVPTHAENNRRAQNLVARMPFVEYPSLRTSSDIQNKAPSLAMPEPEPSTSLAARIQLLIKNDGGVGAIARRCGFSEGAVRSWRDGHSDISRERCVVLARTLGISLLWLVAGEGCMGEQASSLAADVPVGEFTGIRAPGPSEITSIDSRRLAAALKLLQSYIGLIGGSLNPSQRAAGMAELYDILGHAGDPGHVDRLIAFQTALNGHLRQNHSPIA